MSERLDRINKLSRGIEKAKANGDDAVAEQFSKEYQYLIEEETRENPMSDVTGAINAAGQGAMWGMSDEMGGAIDSSINAIKGVFTGDEGLDYRPERDLRRAGTEQWQEDAGFLAGEGTEFAGGMTGPGLISTGRKAATHGMSTAKKVGTTLSEGFSQGMLAGAGEADEFEDIAGDAAVGGGFGAAITGALGTAGYTGGKLWGKYGQDAMRYLGLDDKKKAEELVGRVVKMTGETPDTVMDYLKKLGPEASLMDINDALRTFTSAIANRSDGAITTVTKFLDDRKAGVNDRLKTLLTPDDYGATKAAREATRREAADTLYEFNGATIPVTKELRKFLDNPIVKRELGDIEEKASTSARESRLFPKNNVPKEDLPMVRGMLEDAPELTPEMLADPSVQKILAEMNPSVRLDLIDALKKRLDESGAAAEKNPITGESDRAGREAYETLSTDLRKMADDADPQYAKARETDKYHGDVIRAGEKGEKLNKTHGRDLDTLGDDVSKMSPEEREMFEMAGRDDLYRQATGNKGEDAAKARKLLAGDDSATRLDLVTGGDAEKRGMLQEGIDAEDVFHETGRLTDPGANSRTAVLDMASERADQTANDLGSFGVDVVTFGNPMATSIRAVEGLLSDRTITPGQADELAKILTNKNLTMEQIRRMVDSVPNLTAEAKKKVFDIGTRAAGALSERVAGEAASM